MAFKLARSVEHKSDRYSLVVTAVGRSDRYHVMISTGSDWSERNVERAQMIYCFDSPHDLFLPSLSVARGAICRGMAGFLPRDAL